LVPAFLGDPRDSPNKPQRHEMVGGFKCTRSHRVSRPGPWAAARGIGMCIRYVASSVRPKMSVWGATLVHRAARRPKLPYMHSPYSIFAPPGEPGHTRDGYSHRSHRRRTSHNATPTHRRTRPQDQVTTPVGGPVPTPRPTQCQKRPPLQTQPWLPCPLPLPEHTSQASPPLGSRSDGISRVLQLIRPAPNLNLSFSKLYFS
jgi:hypothetical protein